MWTRLQGIADADTEDISNNIKTTEEVCGKILLHSWRPETWWWNEHVVKAIAAKSKAFKTWKTSKGTRESYNAAKHITRHAVHLAHQEADKEVYQNIDSKSSEVYRLAKQCRREKADVVGDKNDAGVMSMGEDSKQKALLEHYKMLLNVEFDWDPDHLSDEPPVEGPPIPITTDMFKKAISQMKAGKALGPSGIVVEMIWAAGDTGASMIWDFEAAIIRDGKVPSNWEQSLTVYLYKGKGDALDGQQLRSQVDNQVTKVLERIVDGLIGQLVSINDFQFGFLPGRGTTDAIFVVRQLQVKYLDANKRLYMAFLELPRLMIEWLGRSSGGHWENLVWRSGLYDWSRGCMPTHAAMSMLMRCKVESLQWRSEFTKTQCSARCSSSEKRKIDFQDGQLGLPIGMILAVFDPQVTLILPTKFQVNWPFISGEEAKNRFSRWPPPCILNRNDFSCFLSTSHLDASCQLAFRYRRRSEK